MQKIFINDLAAAILLSNKTPCYTEKKKGAMNRLPHPIFANDINIRQTFLSLHLVI